MLNWGNRFNICCLLDNHHYSLIPHEYECILAAGVKASITAQAGHAFEQLETFSTGSEWLFGHFSYDLKNEIESLNSNHPDHIRFSDLFFFIPQTLVILNKSEMLIYADAADSALEIHRQITGEPERRYEQLHNITMQNRFSRTDYIQVVLALKEHIRKGDCYEVNFCQEFFSNDQEIDPVASYVRLGNVSPNPFGAFYKNGDKYLLCASPERYLKKSGDTLMSQPMKGTSKRNTADPELDKLSRQMLAESPKERSENVMVVDLVRNDLSKVCIEGTVSVDELFGIYSFPQVHQMISTVSGKLKPYGKWTDIIRATFPMGSMTGAPKKKVMQLIEHYERTKRGLFSGAVGYRTPEGNFDFNVVIRSILYNSSDRYISCQVGSGITFYSDPEKEYDECILKVDAIKKVLA